MTNVAINGLGRIGRAALRTIVENDDLNLVAINDPHPPEDLQLILNCESPNGRYHRNVKIQDDQLIVDEKAYPLFREINQEDLPWKDLNIDVVFDCPESYSKRQPLKAHCKAGAKKAMNWFDNEEGYISNIVRKAKAKIANAVNAVNAKIL